MFHAFFVTPTMNSDANLSLPEIRRQLDEAIQRVVNLRAVENRLTNDRLPAEEQLELVLQFDDTKKTVSWLGNAVFLNPKPYLLLKTIWNAPEHCAYLETLEKKVWNCQNNEDVSIETMKSLVKRTNEVLETHNAPFRVKPLRCERTDIDGYRL